MSAIVYQNINRGHGLAKGLPELPVGLVSNENFCSLRFIGFACRLDVDSVNVALRAKVMLPHVQAAATENANLNYMNLASDEFAQVAMIYFKIVGPFPNTSALRVRIEVITQRVRQVG